MRTHAGTTSPPSGVTFNPGAVTIGTAIYSVPADAIYVAKTGNDTTGTGSSSAPYATVRKGLSSAGDGKTVVVRAGSYHEGGPQYTSVGNSGLGNQMLFVNNNVTLQNYPGEEVWIEGASTVTNWTADTTSVPGRTVWRAPFVETVNRAPTEVLGETTSTEWGNFLLAEFPIAHWPEQVIYDDVQLQQVQTIAEVTTGTFFVEGAAPPSGGYTNDFTSSAYVIGSDPTGHEVKISDLSRAIGCSKTGCAIKGIGFRNHNPALCSWAAAFISTGATGFTMENCVIKNNSTLGLASNSPINAVYRHCTFYRCGQKGLATTGDGVLVEHCLFEENVYTRFNYGPDAGGIKCGRIHGGTFRYNWFKKNYGYGLWFDQACYQSTVHGNLFTENYGVGLLYEISDQGLFVDNIFIDNGILSTDNSTRKPYAGSPIWISGSNNSRIWHNTFIHPETSLRISNDPRSPYNTNGYISSNGNNSWDPRYDVSWYQANCTWDINNAEVKNNAFVNCAGIDSVQSCFVSLGNNCNDVGVTKTTLGTGVIKAAGNLYLRGGSGTYPIRFANAYPDGVSVKVYSSFTNSGAGTYDPTTSPDQRWSSMFGETGSYLGVMALASALVNTSTYQMTTGAKALVAPTAVPSDVQALLDISPFNYQTVGAGYLSAAL
jgi:hypothetical protein